MIFLSCERLCDACQYCNKPLRVAGLPVPTTLWVGSPPLRRISGEATPRVVALLSRIEAARRQSDPTSLQNRAPRLFLVSVTGAPGDGNAALTRLIKTELVKAGQELQDDAWFEEFPESDFGAFYQSGPANSGFGAGFGAGTNIRGHMFRASYSPYDSLTFNVTYWLTELIKENPAHSDSGMGRLQVDAVLKF